MLSAKIPNKTRREVYRRDGWRCALCDNTQYLQIHHVIPRSVGGSDFPENLITLCWRCHAAAHGTILPGYEMFDEAAIELACVEYVSDLYAGNWYPYK